MTLKSPARTAGAPLSKRLCYREIRLYTHQSMVENQHLYASIGYDEIGRGTEAGYDRVFMRKQLRG